MGVRTGSTPPGSRDGGGGAGSDGGGGAVAEELHGLSLEQRRTVLQVKLQQRRSWENLEQQCLVPPLRMASAIRNLDRARTEDFLKHKIWNRPDRKELVKKHILEDTQAQPALQAVQLRLKRARLAADLNGRLALRPGPIELVQRHILAVDGAGLQLGAGIGGAHVDEEDDARSLSPDSLAPPPQGPSPPPQGPSPPPQGPSLDFSVPGPDPSSPADPGAQQQCGRQGDAASAMGVLAVSLHARQGQPAGVTPPSKPRSPLVKHTQPQPEAGGQRARSRGKDPRPKVRKLKYHQYVPPGQRPAPDKGGGAAAAAAASAPGTATAARSPGGGRPEAPCDGLARGPQLLPAGTTPYTRLLQQQQMFLDLQTLGQPHQQRQPEVQLHHEQQQRQLLGQQRLLPLQAGPHAPSSLPPSSPTLGAIKSEPQTSGPDASPGASSSGSPAHRPGALPSNLDEMKVTELRHELKRRSLPVSGTKPALLERLRRAFSAGGSAPAAATAAAAAAPPPPDGSGSPSGGGCDSIDSSLSPGPCGTPGALAPSPGVKEERTGTPGSEADAAAGDRLLLEMKRRKIQELQRLLEQEQKQADELRRQIAREKSLQHGGRASPPPQQQHSPCFPQAQVSPGYPPGKRASPAFLEASRGPVVPRAPHGRGGPGGCEDALAFCFPRVDPRRRSPPGPTAAPAQQESLAGDRAVPSAPGSCGAEAEADREPPPARTPPVPAGVAALPLEVKREWPAPEREELAAFPDSPLHHRPGPGDALQLETPDLPPSYEDAVKHKGPSMQGGLEQHMDDLLDILIENGEIPASAREQKEPRSSLPGAAPTPARPTGGVGGGHLGLAAAFRLSLSTAAPSPSSSPPSEAQLAASLGVVIGVCGGGGGGGGSDAVWADDDAFWAETEAGAGSESGASDRERDEDGVDWAELASGLAPLAHAPPAGPFSSVDLFDAGGGGKDLVFGAASQLF
uniref:Myocardin-related transcription factor A-like isoform X1 n=1 Tax=Petromyzon marinus TaxID=7757 RepID=A0AAJ7U073_PETMA|nr:myocardin-related transcription factor A-like isoform X1 [Petromyzon marinus]XP_032825918.1 myocardin-related transcription factor A-like isoform X1 [Petromyzon marinus]XP_032825919.1 myocardin-related transcription factor A-like isoform X1 [Petromyzon marinus]XP_032825920.1 myocardin-related transcription factor A-like isoform X1 [Petromyzon marinus]